ncbi:methyl-accepting chemotaxis protein [sulfur-oxidizing endosymbiont of Gigantopelta aegis]|uniref:methyl-accepting chemotaxis protein n=1 Tax=sulfur-oxidizing endosymbiont of Gigantopelta aegis TaxID=2794934 RepID=UPI0018DDCA78|nr:methyl-accepting chemotaxis protein [sulfur-oxidizing endosymbiont of Gigantopelta aegis]
MAKNDERLGFDPLAWMGDSKKSLTEKNIENKANVMSKRADKTTNDDELSTTAKTVLKKQAVKKKVVRKKAVKKKAASIKKSVRKKSVSTPSKKAELSMLDIIRNSFAALEPQAEDLTKTFYERLFLKFPQVKPLFKNTDISKQSKMLLAALKLVVNNLDKPDALEKALANMGQKHQGYGALPEHYPAVAETLLEVMAEYAGDIWTAEVAQAWTDALNLVAEKMLAAYTDTSQTNTEAGTMATPKSTTTSAAFKLQTSMLNAMTSAVMTIDLDLVITYVNPAVQALMKVSEARLRQNFPNFSADNLVGVCIDDFHKNPAHQRKLLSDPTNLPYNGMVDLGDVQFELNVTPMFDEQGKFVGACQEWKNITDILINETEVARLSAAIGGSETATMIADQDLRIVYMNDAVTDLLRNREKELAKIMTGFKVDKLIGTCIDDFHQNPAHQRELLSDMSRLPYRTEIQVLDLHFALNVIGITDKDGKYMGNSVEWRDITEEKNAQIQIDALIQSASRGELSQRLQTDQFEGFMKDLSTGMNTMLDEIVRPIHGVAEVIKALEEGNLVKRMDGEYSGEFASLQETMNQSMDNLLKMVSEIRGSSSHISSAANEISQGNTDLSQRTEQQASSLEETASSMEELTSTVKQNADNSRQANQLAAGARDQAQDGGQVIESTISAMEEINASSKKIEDIIGVIDEIAFQTNLLALNAAVEAARAGEQGRGFAVVASEVRSLAQRSAAAAKEIKALIKDSVEKVDEGTRLVDESGKTLGEIVNSVRKVSDIIAEIAAASGEQSAGIEQVNQAITSLDEVTQQNAALVEEAAAASESMDDQAKSLDEMMSFFETGEGGAEAVRAAPASRPVASAARPAVAPKPKPAAVQTPNTASGDSEWEEF